MSNDMTCEKLREIGTGLRPRHTAGPSAGRSGRPPQPMRGLPRVRRTADPRRRRADRTAAGLRAAGRLRDPGGAGADPGDAGPGRQGARPRSGRLAQGFGGRLRLRLTSAVAALVLAVGFGGWVAGTAIENVVAGARSARRGRPAAWRSDLGRGPQAVGRRGVRPHQLRLDLHDDRPHRHAVLVQRHGLLPAGAARRRHGPDGHLHPAPGPRVLGRPDPSTPRPCPAPG